MNYFIKLRQTAKTWHENMTRTLSGRCNSCGLGCQQGRNCPARGGMPKPTPTPKLVTNNSSCLKRDYRATVRLGDATKLKAVLPNVTRLDALAVIQNHLKTSGFANDDSYSAPFVITLEAVK